MLQENGVNTSGMLIIDEKGYYELRYNDLFAPMVKAIQELKAENEQLRIQLADIGEIKEQIAEIKTLKAELKEQIKILKASNNGDEIKFSSDNCNERTDK